MSEDLRLKIAVNINNPVEGEIFKCGYFEELWEIRSPLFRNTWLMEWATLIAIASKTDITDCGTSRI